MRDFFRASIAKVRGGEGRANPLFPVSKMYRWKKWFLASSAVVLPVGGSIFGLHTLSQPNFQLSNVVITGTACLEQDVVRKQIEQSLAKRVAIFFTRDNKLFFRPDNLEKDLKANLPIDHADIVVDGSTLNVAITEDVVMVLFHSADAWLLSDLNGQVLRMLSPEEVAQLDSPVSPSSEPPGLPFDKIPKITLNEIVAPNLQEPVYPPNRLMALGALDKALRHLGLTPDQYTLDKRKDTWLSVSVKDKPYKLYVDLEKDVADQMRILSAVLAQHDESPGASYIDLRFGNRVFMK